MTDKSLENKTGNQNTTTKTIENVTDDKKNDNLSIKDFAGDATHVIKAPIFILFAEYIGFVSKIINWAEDWCNGKLNNNDPTSLDVYKKKIVTEDALVLYRLAKKEYTDKELSDWYNKFYELILYKFDENLKKYEIQAMGDGDDD